MVHITSASVAVAAFFAIAASAVALPPSSAADEEAGAAANSFDFAAGRVSVKQVRNPKHRRDGVTAAYKAYVKHGIQPPARLEAAFLNGSSRVAAGGSHNNKKRAGNLKSGASATSVNSLDTAYTIPVRIGTPAQTLQLNLDTGSSDMWVFGSQTPSAQVKGQTVYQAASSASARKADGHTWGITYGDGSSSSGIVFADVVQIGNIFYTTQAVEVAEAVSSSFTSMSASDGLLGLGFNTLNTISPTKQNTWFANMKGSLESAVFTADLKHDAVGSYNFGFIDPSLFTGEITYTAVDMNPGWWKFESSGFAIGSGAFTESTIIGIADTGTTLLWLPAAVAEAYWTAASPQATDSSGLWEAPCGANLPSFTFGVGPGGRFEIPGEFMSYGEGDSGMCVGALQSSASMNGLNIFGDTAFKATFVVFEWANADAPRLGFAAKNL